MNGLPGAWWSGETPLLLGTVLVLAALLSRLLKSDRKVVGHSLLFFALWTVLDLAALALARAQPAIAGGLHQVALLGFGVVLIRLFGLLLFRAALPALGVLAPRIVEDIVVIAGYAVWGMVRLSYAGVDLSGIVATSAVITAVVAFAMQDTLGNILGGLALQLDNSLAIGDWVKVDDISGRVVQIQWRFTAILTRNGERVVVPNAQLMKGKFAVVGVGDDSAPQGWRRWLWFAIDYAVPPSQVIAAVEQMLADAEIANVAHRPRPSCVLMEFGPGEARYALRYWLLDPHHDDATDSAVRVHLLATVQRQGWRIALPDQAVHVVDDGEARRERAWQRELARRLQVVAGIELFAGLDEAERRKIAERLVPAPFARGDVMTHQGAEAHWLYVVAGGEADIVWQAADGAQRRLARLKAGSVFGEMGLLTGAPRSATVVAATDVDCYRLDKASFADIIRERPALAEGLSRTLAQRQHEMEALRDSLGREPHGDAERDARHADILGRMKAFFGLG